MAQDTTTITISKWVHRKLVNAKLRRSVVREKPLTWDEFFDEVIDDEDKVSSVN